MIQHVLAFEADGRVLLSEQVREEAHGGVLLSLPVVQDSTHAELFRIDARGDVQRSVRSVRQGAGKPGPGLEAQRQAWRRGDLALAPEAAWALRFVETQAQPSAFWEVAEDIRVLPLRTPTLPPATHTNAFLVGGDELLLIEPAPQDRAECDVLIDAVSRLGAPVRAIALTHHHVDHVGGAAYLSKHLDAPLWAHAQTAKSLPELRFERHLVDGDELCIGGKTLGVIHTPGHARGHLCFAIEEASLLLAGDMVAGVGTILVEPVDGDMNEYLRQLERLEHLGLRRLIPAHGGLVLDGPGLCRGTREHRLRRDAKVTATLQNMSAGGPVGIDWLLPGVYADVPKSLYPLARLSLMAHLLGMEGRGEARRVDGAWQFQIGQDSE